MSKPQTIRAIVVLLAGTLFGIASVHAQTARGVAADRPDLVPDLFIPVEDGSYAQPDAEAHVIRSRAVQVDAAVLQELEALTLYHVGFNLFDDVRFTGVVERIGSPRDGTTSWSGSLGESDLSGFTMVARDGVMAAYIWTAPGATYEVAPYQGVQWVREINPSQVEPCDAEDALPAPAAEPEESERDGLTWQELYGGGGNCDGISEMDVMFLYTPEARDAVGGVEEMESRIDLAVANANAAYDNSLINARVRLVRTGEVDYPDATDWEVALRELTSRDDGVIDEIHTLRDAVGADAVTMVMTGGGGLAWLSQQIRPNRQANAFCLVGSGALEGYVYAHELGHNLGCHHDHGHDGTGVYPYSFGHHFTGDGGTLYRTVMAYPPGLRVGLFSNPDIWYDGAPTGIPPGDPNQADAATTINTSAKISAQFRVRPDDCNGNCTPDADDIAAGTSADTDGNGIPDECEALVLYVKHDAVGEQYGTSWKDAYVDLHDAIIVASNPLNAAEEIWVAAGTYRPDQGTCNRLASFLLPHHVVIYGGFDGTETSLEQRNPDPATNGTILSGDIGIEGNPTDNSYHVAWSSGTVGDVGLDGFTIVDGNADFPPVVPYSRGAAIDMHYSKGVIARCRFTDNTARVKGGAVRLLSGGTVAFEDCEFSDNTSLEERGGAIHNYETSLSVTRCEFTGNSAFGGGGGALSLEGDAPEVVAAECRFEDNFTDFAGGAVFIKDAPDSRAVFNECTFIRNSNEISPGSGVGGAIRSRGDVDLALIGCTFIENWCTGWGGGANIRGGGTVSPLIANCLFVGNEAGEDGGGICITGVQPTIANCTLFENSADGGGGAVAVFDSTVLAQVSNSVLWGNYGALGPELHAGGGATLRVTYSDVQGGQAAAYVDESSTLEWLDVNIDADPLFVDPDGPDNDPNTWEDNDYHLSPGSPCIDAGDNTAVPLDVADLDDDGYTEERTPFDLDGNPRFVQDPFTPDTGVADPPLYWHVVDMGAYEYQFCFGDLDGDDEVGLSDLAELLGHYGTTSGATYYDGDLDTDGDVDLTDLAGLLGAYGTACE